MVRRPAKHAWLLCSHRILNCQISTSAFESLKMQVVIAHQSAIQKARLSRRLNAMPDVDVVRIVSELHETYEKPLREALS